MRLVTNREMSEVFGDCEGGVATLLEASGSPFWILWRLISQ